MGRKRKFPVVHDEAILVEWIYDEIKSFSVAKIGDICEGELRALGKQLIGMIVDINWGKDVHRGKILDVGSVAFLSEICDELAQGVTEDGLKETPPTDAVAVLPQTPTTNAKKRSKKVDKTETASTISHVLSLIQVNSELNAPETVDESASYEFESSEIAKNNSVSLEEFEKVSNKYKKLKERFRSLKEKYKSLKEQLQTDSNVELYPETGVFVPRDKLESARIVSNEKTVLARNLFRLVFSQEELSSFSLFGKGCNANKNLQKSTLPEIDATRRDAVINFVLKAYGANVDGLSKEGKLWLRQSKRDVKKSLSDFLREENRKARCVKPPGNTLNA